VSRTSWAIKLCYQQQARSAWLPRRNVLRAQQHGRKACVRCPRAQSCLSLSCRHRAQVTGHRAQVTGHRAQVTGHRSQVTGHRAEGRGQRAEGRGQRAEGRGQRAEGTGHRAEGRGHRAQVSGAQSSRPSPPALRVRRVFGACGRASFTHVRTWRCAKGARSSMSREPIFLTGRCAFVRTVGQDRVAFAQRHRADRKQALMSFVDRRRFR
jgi:hypothetical protein